MARSHRKDPSIDQSNDASSIGNKRDMARRAKRQSNKTDRQALQRELTAFAFALNNDYEDFDSLEDRLDRGLNG